MTIDTIVARDHARSGTRRRDRTHECAIIEIPILQSGVLAREFCRCGTHAQVVAVFERSLYLRSGHIFVCLGEPTIGNGPLTLIASPGSGNHLSDLKLRPGQMASVWDRAITIDSSVRFILDRCEPWRPLRWPLRPTHRALEGICRAIAGLAAAEAPVEGFGRIFCWQQAGTRVTPLARIARERIARFEWWLGEVLEAHDVSGVVCSKAVQGLIGLGPGLTPSGDDFLVGALALLDALAERKVHAAVSGTIVAAPRGLTSPLSDCLLRAAAAGHVGENLHCAISALMSGAPDQAVAAIRNIGHSSGWDMLAGIVITLRVIAVRAPA